jgi:hypothetical protein
MLMNHEYSVEFLTSKIGPYVETNPVTGRPRLIRGLNEVWQAIEEFGGIAFTAKQISIAEIYVHKFIDNHYMPVAFAVAIAKKLGCKLGDIQMPSTGYEDPVTGECWPLSWLLIDN